MGNNTVIKVENLSKQYRLGEVGTGTISHDLNRWWHRVRGKEDPYLRIGESNDRSKKGDSEYVWAIQDINFEVQQGEVLGIIGKNGAGKSTLLKILSKVTAPTTGSIKAKGRIAALLEVGTGFHPELTGRENIYLNGTILGMTKREVTAKLDEIVDFAGVERYLDTPVKRYSSGMMVRLGFAVAAHLEPEILIVDEVLAVGDAEFQKKAVGKMQEVSKEGGRTVLFVSHNMNSVQVICTECLFLRNGEVVTLGKPVEIIQRYLKNQKENSHQQTWEKLHEAPGNSTVRLFSLSIIDENFHSKNLFSVDKRIGISMEYEVFEDNRTIWCGFNLFNSEGTNVFDSHSVKSAYYREAHKVGKYKAIGWIPGNLLNENTYYVNVALFNHKEGIIHCHVKDMLSFSVVNPAIPGLLTAKGNIGGDFPGIISPLLDWQIQKQ